MKPAPMPWRYVIALVVAGVLGTILALGLLDRALQLTQPQNNQEASYVGEQEKSTKALRKFVRDPIAWLTVLIAVSTCGLWGMAIVTARRQLRAYIWLESSEVDEEGGTFSVVLKFTNAGQTPAHGFYVFSDIGVFEKDAKMQPVPSPNPADADQCVVGPGGSYRYRKVITPDDISLVKSGSLYVFIWGEARYRDIFRRNRRFPFVCRTGYMRGRWVLQPKGGPEGAVE